jgi:hypothetical protein
MKAKGSGVDLCKREKGCCLSFCRAFFFPRAAIKRPEKGEMMRVEMTDAPLAFQLMSQNASKRHCDVFFHSVYWLSPHRGVGEREIEGQSGWDIE